MNQCPYIQIFPLTCLKSKVERVFVSDRALDSDLLNMAEDANTAYFIPAPFTA